MTTIADPSLRQRLPLYPAQFLSAVPMASLGPLLDSMMRDVGVPLSHGGVISAGLFLGTAVGLVLFNTVTARWSLKWTLCVSTFLLGASLALGGGLAQSLWTLFVACCVAGLTTGLVFNTCFAWLSAHMRRNLAGSALAMIVFFGFAMTFVPLAVGQALNAGVTWRQVLITEGAFVVAWAVVFALLPLLDTPERRNVRLSHLRAVGKHDPWLLLGILGAGFTYTGSEVVMNFWLPKYHIDVFASAESWASLSVTLFWVGIVVGRIGFIPLTRRFPASRLLMFCMSLMAVFAIAMAIAPSQAAALGFAVGAGLGASASFGLIGSCSKHFPGWQSGVVMSLFIFSGALGGTVLPYALGPIASATDFRTAMGLVALPALACVLFAELIHRRAERPSP